MSARDVPADTGDAEALTDLLDRTLSYSRRGLITRRSMAQAEAVLASDWLAARDAAQRADERERIAQAIEAEGGGSVTFRIAANIARSGTAGGSDA